MKTSKNLKYVVIASLFSLASSNQLNCGGAEQIKETSAKFGHNYPYIPAFVTSSGLFGITGFLKKTPFKRLSAFSLATFTGTFFCEALSANYLKTNISCFEWMSSKQTPSFTNKAKTFLQNLKNRLS